MALPLPSNANSKKKKSECYVFKLSSRQYQYHQDIFFKDFIHVINGSEKKPRFNWTFIKCYALGAGCGAKCISWIYNWRYFYKTFIIYVLCFNHLLKKTTTLYANFSNTAQRLATITRITLVLSQLSNIKNEWSIYNIKY